MNSNQLTVVILTYNRAQFLGEAIKAVLNQTYKNFTLLILDNGSTDKTTEVVKSFNDPRIKYVKHLVNIGSVGNYNSAIELVDDEFLLITHDDDRMKPDLVEKELSVLKNDLSINLVCSDVDLINSKGITKEKNAYQNRFQFNGNFTQNTLEFISGYFQGFNYICCPTVMLRNSFIENYKLRFSNSVGPGTDTYFWFELNLLPGRFLFLNESLYEYRIHESQDSSINSWKIYSKLKRPVDNFLRQNNLEKYCNESRRFFNKNLMHYIWDNIFKKNWKPNQFNEISTEIILKEDFILKAILRFYFHSPNTFFFLWNIRQLLISTIKKMISRFLKCLNK